MVVEEVEDVKMSRGINWFKDFKIEEEIIDYGLVKDSTYKVKLIGGDSTSFSEGNITKYQEAFKKYDDIQIPYRDFEYCYKPTDLDLIEPKVLSEVCYKILSDCILDKYGIKDRIEWFKELSDKGYYFCFDRW
jgi:hypothetical protein